MRKYAQKRAVQGLAPVFAAVALLGGCGGPEMPAAPAPRQLAMAATLVGTATFSGNRANYTLTRTATTASIYDNVGGTGHTDVTGKATLQFADMTVNLGVLEKSQAIAAADLKTLVELYVAFFNRVPDADGLSFWIDQFSSGMSIDTIADNFYAAAVQFSSVTGYSATMTNADFVRIIYANVLGRSGSTAPPDADVNFWAGRLADGTDTRGSLIRSMLGSAHTFKGDATWGWVADLLDNKYTVAGYFSIEQGLNFNTSEESITRTMAIAAAVTPTDTTAAIALVGVANPPAPAPPPPAPAVTFSRVQTIINQRCVPCHTPSPDGAFGFDSPPGGITLNSETKIRALKDQIYQLSVLSSSMPYQNRTAMTTSERTEIGTWYLDGAP